MSSRIKQALIIGGTVAFIVWLAIELNKRYPLFPKGPFPEKDQVNFN